MSLWFVQADAGLNGSGDTATPDERRIVHLQRPLEAKPYQDDLDGGVGLVQRIDVSRNVDVTILPLEDVLRMTQVHVTQTFREVYESHCPDRLWRR